MKLKLLLVSLVSLASLMSCSSGNNDNEASSKLTMDIGDTANLLIPATDFSCEEISKGSLVGTGAIGKSYFRIPNPKISWNTTDPQDKYSQIRIVLLNFRVDSPLMKYECTLSGASLGILYYLKSPPDSNGIISVTPWDQTLGYNFATDAATNSTSELLKTYTSCEIKCGGVNIPPGTSRFTVKGRWELFGVQRRYSDINKTSYEEFPLKIQGDFTVQNPLQY